MEPACQPVAFGGMSTIAFDVEAVRGRFSALQGGFVFFDGPGGTQVPDSVIEAVSAYFRDSNANVGGPYDTSRRTEAVIAQARLAAASFLGAEVEEIAFGQNMTINQGNPLAGQNAGGLRRPTTGAWGNSDPSEPFPRAAGVYMLGERKSYITSSPRRSAQ